MSSTSIPLGGVEARNRELLGRMHRAFQGPFTVADAAAALAVTREQVGRLLPYLASRGWLVRVKRGLYATVPLEAADPDTWPADPWAVAAKCYAPCYVGGWTALHHWELTDQIFGPVVVFTATSVRAKEQEHQGTAYRLRQVHERRMFGTSIAWRSGVPVPVSDPERTLVDVLDRPAVGGGIRHVADCVEEWFRTKDASRRRLIDYAGKHGNRTVFKRLGYVLEAREIDAPGVVSACRAGMSSGLSPLDPSSTVRGRVLKRWNVRVNARV